MSFLPVEKITSPSSIDFDANQKNEAEIKELLSGRFTDHTLGFSPCRLHLMDLFIVTTKTLSCFMEVLKRIVFSNLHNLSHPSIKLLESSSCGDSSATKCCKISPSDIVLLEILSPTTHHQPFQRFFLIGAHTLARGHIPIPDIVSK